MDVLFNTPAILPDVLSNAAAILLDTLSKIAAIDSDVLSKTADFLDVLSNTVEALGAHS